MARKKFTLARLIEPYRRKYIGLGSEEELNNFLNPVATSTDLGDPDADINTVDKYVGKPAYDTTLGEPVWASGPDPSDPWEQATGTGGGGGTPAAPFNSVQFNNAGSFGGEAEFTFDGTTLFLDTQHKININSQAADENGLNLGDGSIIVGNQNGNQVAIDRLGIQQKSNGTTAGTLNINNFGGAVNFGNGIALTGMFVNAPEVTLGTLGIDTTQNPGASEDGWVWTYDFSTDRTRLAAPASGGGGSTGVQQQKGSWTPVLSDGTNDATMVNQTGRWVRLGDMVYVTCFITVNSVAGTSGPARITGLPFPAINVNAGFDFALAVSDCDSLAVAADRVPQAQVENGSDYITLHKWEDAGSAQSSPMTTAEVSNNGEMKINGHYIAEPLPDVFTTIIDVSTFGLPPVDITTDGAGNWVVVCTSGSSSEIWYSSDGGLNWTETASVISISTGLNSVAYQNGVWVAMAVGFDVILRSTDSGVTWSEERDNPNTNANGVTEVQGGDGIGLFLTNGNNQTLWDADGLEPWTQNSNGPTFLPNQFIFVDNLAYIYGDSGANNPRNGFTTNGSSFNMNNDMPTTGDFNGRPNGDGDHDGINFILVANAATGGGATDQSFRYWWSPTFSAPWNSEDDNRYDSAKTDTIELLTYCPAQALWYVVTEVGDVYRSADPTLGVDSWTEVTDGLLPGNIPLGFAAQDVASDAWIFINDDRDLVVNSFV